MIIAITRGVGIQRQWQNHLNQLLAKSQQRLPNINDFEVRTQNVGGNNTYIAIHTCTHMLHWHLFLNSCYNKQIRVFIRDNSSTRYWHA